MKSTSSLSAVAVTAALAIATAVATAVAPATQPEATAQPGSTTESLAPVPLPQDDPFYVYSGETPLEQVPPGTPLHQREIAARIQTFATPLRATQILYRTEDTTGHAWATATTVITPPQPNGRVVSYQSAYDSLTPECQPSYMLAGGLDRGLITSSEWAAMATYLARGYTVITSDFEGQDPHFASGPAYAKGTLDGIRAASRAPDTGVTEDSRVAMVGYSGGAIATQWAAEYAPDYAPDVDRRLVGAAMGGNLIAPLTNLRYVDGSPLWKGVIPMALVGISRAYGEDLTPYLSDYGKQVLGRAGNECITQTLLDSLVFHNGARFADLVKPEFADPESIEPLTRLADKLVQGRTGTPTTPLFIRQGRAGFIEATANDQPGMGPGDGVMVVSDNRKLARDFCRRGVTVDYHEYPLFSHLPSFLATISDSVPWVEARFAGAPDTATCGMLEPGGEYGAVEPGGPYGP